MMTNTLLDKVPRIYEVASKVLQFVQETGEDAKALIFNKDETRVPQCTKPWIVHYLVTLTIRYEFILARLLRESNILENEGLDPWLARVLITELFWGRKTFPSTNAQALATVREHRQTFIKILEQTKLQLPKDEPDDFRPCCALINTLVATFGDAIKALTLNGWRQETVPMDDYSTFLEMATSLEGKEFLQDYHVKNLLVFPPLSRVEKFDLEAMEASLLFLDKAHALASSLLNPTPGSTVLNMCAAQGINVIHLATIMENKGKIYANAKSLANHEKMCSFIYQHGVACVMPLCQEATTLALDDSDEVEYILVDPPCSRTGSKCLNVSLKHWATLNENRMHELVEYQVDLLEQALAKYPSVKRVVYTTSSLIPKENEEVVEKVLSIVNADGQRFKVVNALTSWPGRGSDNYEIGPRCLFSKKDTTNGFFIAVIEQAGSLDEESSEGESIKTKPTNLKRKNKGTPAAGKRLKSKKKKKLAD